MKKIRLFLKLVWEDNIKVLLVFMAFVVTGALVCVAAIFGPACFLAWLSDIPVSGTIVAITMCFYIGIFLTYAYIFHLIQKWHEMKGM